MTPTDAINTAEGEAWLAQRAVDMGNPIAEQDQEVMPPSPPQAPQDVAEVLARVSEFALMVELFGEWNADSTDRRMVYQSRELWASDLRRLAAALTPRELTDEEAERGARAIRKLAVELEHRNGPESLAEGLTDADPVWFAEQYARAAYRAITEEPAR